MRVGEASNPGPNQFDDPEFDGGHFDSIDFLAEQSFEPILSDLEDEPPDTGSGAYFGADVVIETRQFIRAKALRGSLGMFSGSKPGMCFRLRGKGLGHYQDSQTRQIRLDP